MTDPAIAAILAEVQAFAAAWSTGDARRCAAFFTDDAVRVGALGDVQRGRAEIQAAFERLFHGPFAGATITQDPGTVRILAPGIALWQGGMRITAPDGTTRTGHVVQLMLAAAERWLVVETHPKLFPAAPVS